ncbi:MAG: 4-hydroxythreonine-4-phosphate dehydrogenase PdxA [SAR324 cluster bacterium]|nr:4-hydroxythreonine-4-phosphate dehydrogenase PdxA [SAR324 cluster bacterium]
MPTPTLGLLLGDPSGIGPELCAKLVAEEMMVSNRRIMVIGDRIVLEKGCATAGVNLDIKTVDSSKDLPESGVGLLNHPRIAAETIQVGAATVASGTFALESLRTALDLARTGSLDGFTFAPFNKESLRLGGNTHEDELRFAAEELRFEGYCGELNTTKGLWTSRVTSHIPLKDVSAQITQSGIEKAVNLAHQTLLDAGVTEPRIAVAALNPHAGDGGNFGTEEIDTIGPAVTSLQQKGFPVQGPFPADTVFVRTTRGDFDAVVTMYHDQGQIALKLLGFDRGVTVLGGLPIPITTPAHGTAFDIAGKGVASVDALKEAWNLLTNMVTSRLVA